MTTSTKTKRRLDRLSITTIIILLVLLAPSTAQIKQADDKYSWYNMQYASFAESSSSSNSKSKSGSYSEWLSGWGKAIKNSAKRAYHNAHRAYKKAKSMFMLKGRVRRVVELTRGGVVVIFNKAKGALNFPFNLFQKRKAKVMQKMKSPGERLKLKSDIAVRKFDQFANELLYLR